MKIWSLSGDKFYRTTFFWYQKDSLLNVVLLCAPKKNCVYLFYAESEGTGSPRNGSENLQVLGYHDLENRSINLKKEVYHFISKEKYLLTYLLTYSMEQSPSWEANRLLASQEIPLFLWTR